MGSMLRVAPLFETLEDLEHSESAMEQLLSDPWYAAHINGEQECMIGYSDSGKDAGRMAAAWGLYEVQVGLPSVIPGMKIRQCEIACLLLADIQDSRTNTALHMAFCTWRHGCTSCQTPAARGNAR